MVVCGQAVVIQLLEPRCLSSCHSSHYAYNHVVAKDSQLVLSDTVHLCLDDLQTSRWQ